MSQKIICRRMMSPTRGLKLLGRFLKIIKGLGSRCGITDEKALFKFRQTLSKSASQMWQQLKPKEIGLSHQYTISNSEHGRFVELIFQEDGTNHN